MPDDRAQKALTEAKSAIAMVVNPRLEAVREQLSEIVFGDESHSLAQCLGELRRRKLAEVRLAAWFVASDDALRSRTQSVIGEKLKDYRSGAEAFAGAGYDGLPQDADTWTELDQALDKIGFPRWELIDSAPISLCECCKIATECSFVERTGQPSAWLCADCATPARRAP